MRSVPSGLFLLLVIASTVIGTILFGCSERPQYLLDISSKIDSTAHIRFSAVWNTAGRARSATYITPMSFELTETPVIISIVPEKKFSSEILKVRLTRRLHGSSEQIFWGASKRGTVFMLSEHSMGYIPGE